MSRHTSRFSWIDASDKPHNITEFFSRFCNKKVPYNHPDKSLVSSRLIAKSRVTIDTHTPSRPNSRLLSPSFISKLPTSGPSSDRVADSIDKTTNALRENPSVSLSTSLAELTAQTKANGDGSLELPSVVPSSLKGFVRPDTVVSELLQVPARTSHDSPAEIVSRTEDHSARALTGIQEGDQTIPCNSSKLDSSLDLSYIPSEVPTVHNESDQVASNILEQIVPKQQCLVSGCNYSGVAFMSNGCCVKHKDAVLSESVSRDSPSPFARSDSSQSSYSEASSFSLSTPSFGNKHERANLVFLNLENQLISIPNPFFPSSANEDSRKKCSGCHCTPKPLERKTGVLSNEDFRKQLMSFAAPSTPKIDPNALHHLLPSGLCIACNKIRQTLTTKCVKMSLSEQVAACHASGCGSGFYPEFCFCYTCNTLQEGNHPCERSQKTSLLEPTKELTKTQKKKMKKSQK